MDENKYFGGVEGAWAHHTSTIWKEGKKKGRYILNT